MLGRELGKGLIALSKKIAPKDETPIDIVAGLTREWKEHECALARANGHEERVANITDRAECILATLEGLPLTNAGQLRLALTALFATENARVVLSSIHKAKGLEWNTVVHLDPWRIPSKFAKQAASRGDRSQLEQEMNLRYVAETRTRDILINANLEDFQS